MYWVSYNTDIDRNVCDGTDGVVDKCLCKWRD